MQGLFNDKRLLTLHAAFLGEKACGEDFVNSPVSHRALHLYMVVLKNLNPGARALGALSIASVTRMSAAISGVCLRAIDPHITLFMRASPRYAWLRGAGYDQERAESADEPARWMRISAETENDGDE